MSQKREKGIFNKSYWYNGYYSFCAEKKGDKIYFTGESPYENGLSFVLKEKDKTHFEIVPNDDRSTTYECLGINEPGNVTLELKIIPHFNSFADEGTDRKDTILIVHNAQNEVQDFLIKYDGNLEKSIEDDLRRQLDGCYKTGSNALFYFAGNTCLLSNGGDFLPYKLGTDNEILFNIIRTDTNGNYTYYLTPEGLKLYNAYYSKANDRWEQGEMVMKLERVVSDLDNGRWGFTADQLLTRHFLDRYDKKTLLLMKNEILARHGYRFPDPQMNRYFESQRWILSSKNNANIKLSEIEQLNMSLLENMEKKK